MIISMHMKCALLDEKDIHMIAFLGSIDLSIAMTVMFVCLMVAVLLKLIFFVINDMDKTISEIAGTRGLDDEQRHLYFSSSRGVD